MIVAVAALATLLSLAGLWLDQDDALALPLLGVLIGGTTLTLYSLLLACANDVLTPQQTLAASSSLVLALGVGAILGPLTTGLLMDVLGPDGFLWDLVLIHALLAAFGGYCLVRHPSARSEEHGHYVAVPAGTAPLGATWVEEAASEPTQLELGLVEAAPEPAPDASLG